MMSRGHNAVLRVSSDARSLSCARNILNRFGWLLCLLLPFIALFALQGEQSAMLTSQTFLGGSSAALWTGHLLHYTFEHFAWDALMFVVFASLLWREERWRMWIWLLVAAPLISIAVFWSDSSLNEYRGLSALDTMLFARFCLGLCGTGSAWNRCLFGVLPLGGLFAKIVYECTTGNALFASELGPGVVPLPSAHLLGIALGSLWWATRWERSSVWLENDHSKGI